MQLRLGTVLAAAISLLTTVGCQRSEPRFLAREVAPEELVGTWVLRSESVHDLDAIGAHLGDERTSHRIELESDGGCDFQTFLPENVQLTGPPPVLTSSRCRWKLSQSGAHQQLSIELLDTRSNTIRYSFTQATGGELVIWQTIGDPDAWRYLEYSKADS